MDATEKRNDPLCKSWFEAYVLTVGDDGYTIAIERLMLFKS